MCGIVGIFGDLQDKEIQVNQMLEKIYHRGPDDKGSYQENLFSAGMRRLSINDVEGGSQPFFNESKSIMVIYNGEIYNHLEIRESLKRKGYNFNSDSDGEIIAHLYEDVGENLFQYFDGMFAIAIWDIKKKLLLLGRDIAGEKPLYYHRSNKNELIFASEIKCFQCINHLSLNLNEQAIWDYPTFLWIPEPNTIYKHIHALPKSSYLAISKDRFEIKEYENIHRVDLSSTRTIEDLIEITRSTIEDSIKSRLLSDVPIGSFLSGGLDSTIVSMVASNNIKNLDTFTVSFPDLVDPYDGKSDESKDAIYTSNLIGSNHHNIKVTSNDFYSYLDDFTHFGDQPFAVSSGLGVFAISKFAKESGIKVLLTGDGADECFGGYSWYKHLQIINDYKEENIDKIVTFQNIGLSESERVKYLNSCSPQYRGYAWHYYAHEKEKKKLFSNDFCEGKISSLSHFEGLKLKNDPGHYIEHDRNFYFPNEMLVKADRMNMANSVEGRVPFASPKVLSLSNQLSTELMIRGNELKWILRKAFSDIIPEEILKRPKHGFNVPIDNWLTNDWSHLVEEAFENGSALHKYNLIKNDTLTIAMDMINSKDRLNGHTIFSFIMLNKWLEKK